MIDTDKYEGHTPGPWHEIFMQGDEYNNGYDDLQTLGFNGTAQDLIADAPLLLEEYVRVTNVLRYVGARLYLDKNNYRHYDYAKLLDLCRRNSGEPDDMSGPMGAIITELIHYDEKLEEDKEMIE